MSILWAVPKQSSAVNAVTRGLSQRDKA